MRPFFLTVALLFCAAELFAQSVRPASVEIFAGYSLLSNSFNGLPGSREPLNGADASLAIPGWHGLRFKLDVSRYHGTNLGAKQQGIFIMGGGQYERTFHRERWFVEALFGDVAMNRYWGPESHAGMACSFVTELGAGLDTPLNQNFTLRVQGDYRFSNLALIQSASFAAPYRIPGLPQNFASLSTGLVWNPHTRSTPLTQASSSKREPVEAEVTVEDLNSFGHFHIFAVSSWSYLHVAGVEYDRHSWDRFLGARRDWVAEFLPVVVFKQPTKTDVWGNPKSSTFTTIYGVGIAPVGMRLLWRDAKIWKPFYTIKGGVVGFNQKAISQNAAYLNFTLQQTIGMQFRVHDGWDVRSSIEHFHISDAFIVPSNPGIDEMSYNVGLTYHLGRRSSALE